MAYQQTRGVVIYVTDYGESDQIVTFYGPLFGKQTAIAKGAKRSKKRFVNKLEIFTLLNIIYNDRYALPLIDQAELCNSHILLRHNYQAYTAATLLCEIIRNWIPEHQNDAEIFHYLLWALDELCHSSERIKIIILFLIKFFRRLGYQPALKGCRLCHQLDPGGSPYSFQVQHGGLTCCRCHRGNYPTNKLSLSTIKLLSKALELPPEKLSRLHFSAASTKEAINLFRNYERYLLDKDLNSWNHL